MPPVSNAPPEKDKSELAAYLWGQSAPLDGTVAEAYLTSCGCLVQSDALRFLPARGEHPPAMIAPTPCVVIPGTTICR